MEITKKLLVEKILRVAQKLVNQVLDLPIIGFKLIVSCCCWCNSLSGLMSEVAKGLKTNLIGAYQNWEWG
jgi:hypothetical protein